jgi:hypothetical protein
LPSTFSSISKSVAESCRGLTLIWMLIAGWRDGSSIGRGAFGFSNEKSFTYCRITLSCAGSGWPVGGVSPPLVVIDIDSPSGSSASARP